MTKLTIIVKKTNKMVTIRGKSSWRVNRKTGKLIIKSKDNIFRFDIDKIEFYVNNIFKDLELI